MKLQEMFGLIETFDGPQKDEKILAIKLLKSFGFKILGTERWFNGDQTGKSIMNFTKIGFMLILKRC